MPRTDAPAPDPRQLSSLEKQREYLSIASSYLDHGLKADEGQNYAQALTLYSKGLEVLRAGLDVRAGDLLVAETMRRHLHNFGDRMCTLQVLANHPQGDAPISSSSDAPPREGHSWMSKVRSLVPQSLPKQGPSKALMHEDGQLSRLQYSLRTPSSATAKPQLGQSPIPPCTLKAGDKMAGCPPGETPHADYSAPYAKAAPKGLGKGGADTTGTLKRLQRAGADHKLLHTVLNCVVPSEDQTVSWDDIVGLDEAKQALYESVMLPLQRPDLFTGLRAPSRGILLFGPPGTGKTFLARACAQGGGATFFSISASTLTSKWVGEGEKLVKALFLIAQELQPAIIFVDEIDSLLTSRSDHETESSRRLKTEFMVQMEGLGVTCESANRVLVLGATNRPFELDDAILRRFPRRLYIALPDAATRQRLFTKLGEQCEAQLSAADSEELAQATEGYSSSDITNVCREAVMMPIRELGPAVISVPVDQLRQPTKQDFLRALLSVRPTVSEAQLHALHQWATAFGSA
uniref:AAA+ ATPase domain-containing protein n=1 Tax=Eutreptiella gymnastica TaxID=73025 RepID=A0A7S1ND01_9EUGL|mmetsp:Transcript_17662/g.31327  ORF Transcript_17662/g.31327 Transcript_17662/m.31327 type:complete len:519 (+) Transcript_17662:70-1626(+)